MRLVIWDAITLIMTLLYWYRKSTLYQRVCLLYYCIAISRPLNGCYPKYSSPYTQHREHHWWEKTNSLLRKTRMTSWHGNAFCIACRSRGHRRPTTVITPHKWLKTRKALPYLAFPLHEILMTEELETEVHIGKLWIVFRNTFAHFSFVKNVSYNYFTSIMLKHPDIRRC